MNTHSCIPGVADDHIKSTLELKTKTVGLISTKLVLSNVYDSGQARKRHLTEEDAEPMEPEGEVASREPDRDCSAPDFARMANGKRQKLTDNRGRLQRRVQPRLGARLGTKRHRKGDRNRSPDRPEETGPYTGGYSMNVDVEALGEPLFTPSREMTSALPQQVFERREEATKSSHLQNDHHFILPTRPSIPHQPSPFDRRDILETRKNTADLPETQDDMLTASLVIPDGRHAAPSPFDRRHYNHPPPRVSETRQEAVNVSGLRDNQLITSPPLIDDPHPPQPNPFDDQQCGNPLQLETREGPSDPAEPRVDQPAAPPMLPHYPHSLQPSPFDCRHYSHFPQTETREKPPNPPEHRGEEIPTSPILASCVRPLQPSPFDRQHYSHPQPPVSSTKEASNPPGHQDEELAAPPIPADRARTPHPSPFDPRHFINSLQVETREKALDPTESQGDQADASPLLLDCPQPPQPSPFDPQRCSIPQPPVAETKEQASNPSERQDNQGPSSPIIADDVRPPQPSPFDRQHYSHPQPPVSSTKEASNPPGHQDEELAAPPIPADRARTPHPSPFDPRHFINSLQVETREKALDPTESQGDQADASPLLLDCPRPPQPSPFDPQRCSIPRPPVAETKEQASNPSERQDNQGPSSPIIADDVRPPQPSPFGRRHCYLPPQVEAREGASDPPGLRVTQPTVSPIFPDGIRSHQSSPFDPHQPVVDAERGTLVPSVCPKDHPVPQSILSNASRPPQPSPFDSRHDPHSHPPQVETRQEAPDPIEPRVDQPTALPLLSHSLRAPQPSPFDCQHYSRSHPGVIETEEGSNPSERRDNQRPVPPILPDDVHPPQRSPFDHQRYSHSSQSIVEMGEGVPGPSERPDDQHPASQPSPFDRRFYNHTPLRVSETQGAPNSSQPRGDAFVASPPLPDGVTRLPQPSPFDRQRYSYPFQPTPGTGGDMADRPERKNDQPLAHPLLDDGSHPPHLIHGPPSHINASQGPIHDDDQRPALMGASAPKHLSSQRSKEHNTTTTGLSPYRSSPKQPDRRYSPYAHGNRNGAPSARHSGAQGLATVLRWVGNRFWLGDTAVPFEPQGPALDDLRVELQSDRASDATDLRSDGDEDSEDEAMDIDQFPGASTPAPTLQRRHADSDESSSGLSLLSSRGPFLTSHEDRGQDFGAGPSRIRRRAIFYQSSDILEQLEHLRQEGKRPFSCSDAAQIIETLLPKLLPTANAPRAPPVDQRPLDPSTSQGRSAVDGNRNVPFRERIVATTPKDHTPRPRDGDLNIFNGEIREHSLVLMGRPNNKASFRSLPFARILRYFLTRKPEDGPTKENFALCHDTKALQGQNLEAALVYNERGAEVFADDFVVQEKYSCNDRSLIRKQFLHHLYGQLQNQYDGKKGTVRDRRIGRRRSRRNRRSETARVVSRVRGMGKFPDIWKAIPYEACSGDESEYDQSNQKVFKITKLDWRHPAIRAWMQVWDDLNFKIQVARKASGKSGRLPYTRYNPEGHRGGTALTESHRFSAPRHLPRNFYSPQYLEGLTTVQLELLDIQPAIPLNFPPEILNWTPTRNV